MRLCRLTVALAAGVAALGLSACAESINATVSRYQAMPAPQGQSFFVVPDGGMAHNGGLEFQRYAGLVAQQLETRGFRPAADAQSANMIVQFGYGVDRGQVRYVDTGFYGGFGPRWGRGDFFSPRFGRGFRGGFLWGWDDPFWYGGGVDSYVEYHSQIGLHIRSAQGNAPLFDGRAQARSDTNRLDVVIPSLVDAMFTGFPGRSGEVVKITIPTRPPTRPPARP
jgi:hypothetical protein